jgi:hypothetical protein
MLGVVQHLGGRAALLLPTGEVAGEGVCPLREPDPVQQTVRLGHRLVPGHVVHPAQRHGDGPRRPESRVCRGDGSRSGASPSSGAPTCRPVIAPVSTRYIRPEAQKMLK